MANTVITGIGDLRDQFKRLDRDIRLKTSRRMVVAAGRVLREEARSIAQNKGLRKTGALIKNIAIKRERSAPVGTEQYHLGVRHGRSLGNGKRAVKFLAVNNRGRIVTRRKDDPFYWRFHEFGTKYLPRQDFISGSLRNKRREAQKAMADQLQKDLLIT